MEESFFSGLSATDNMLPIHLYYRLLKQAQITLNMLSPSKHNPNISAHAMMEENFDLNKTPLAPQGTNITVHEN